MQQDRRSDAEDEWKGLGPAAEGRPPLTAVMSRETGYAARRRYASSPRMLSSRCSTVSSSVKPITCR